MYSARSWPYVGGMSTMITGRIGFGRTWVCCQLYGEPPGVGHCGQLRAAEVTTSAASWWHTDHFTWREFYDNDTCA